MQYFKKGLPSIGQMMRTNLLNPYVISAILVSPIVLMGSPKIMAAEIKYEFIQSIDTALFSPSSPDPSGIVYFPSTKVQADDTETGDFFLITDGEVNEMDMFRGVNVFKVDRDGNQIIDPETSLPVTFSTIKCVADGPCTDEDLARKTPVNGLASPPLRWFSDEPTGITFNPNNMHYFISDDNPAPSIHEIDPGDDKIHFTADDVVTSFSATNSFTSGDPEDVTYGNGNLFIVDGSAEEVYIIEHGDDGLDNKLVGQFDTEVLGLHNPEGIVFDATNNSLYIVSKFSGDPIKEHSDIVHTTTYGVLLDTLKYTGDIPFRSAGLALAPTSSIIYPSRNSLYIVARGVDNDEVLEEGQDVNDGKLYELMLPATTPGNDTPTVSAGMDSAITLPANAQLNGTINDNVVPDVITATWSKVSGPGDVSYTDAHDALTSASFSMAGAYVLRLTGYDGELYDYDDVAITVKKSDGSITVKDNDPSSGSSGGSTSRTLLLFLALLSLVGYRRKNNLLTKTEQSK